MSSFLGAGGTYGFNLDLIKSPSSSSGCSSTISKLSSVSSLAIHTKRARTPRKRPNQSYMEAATLLSTACPTVFSIKNLHKKHSGSLSSGLSCSSLLSSSAVLPAFPVLNESDFLVEEPLPDRNSTFQFKFNPVTPVVKPGIPVLEASPPSSPKYDVDSIFDDEVVEGIDSIMGKLSMNDCDSDCNPNINPYINPFVGCPMGLGIGGKLGFGLGQWGNNLRQVFRGEHNEDLWRLMPMVQMKDIVLKFNALPSLEKKKTKKKMKKVEEVMKDESKTIISRAAANIIACPSKLEGHLNSGLGLKLNHEEVIEAWGDQGFPISSDFGAPESSAEIAARLAEIDLVPDSEGGGTREASVLRYREKRKTRLFSNKIRYQVRKVNADCKPRMKGRFVKHNRVHHQTVEEESQ